MSHANQESDVQNLQDVFDEEAADAAHDMLRLFTRAVTFVHEARLMRRRGDAEWWTQLAEMRRRLSDAIVDDCLLFSEQAIAPLFDFLSAWRVAAYLQDAEREASADAELERNYRRVVIALSSHMGTSAG